MADLFIAHAEEDGGIVASLAKRLETAGYSTWHYGRDTLPGWSYLVQVTEEIDRCRAFVVVVSPNSLGSRQVTTEIVRAYESHKPLIPLLVGLSHLEFQKRQPEWRAALGAAPSIQVTDCNAEEVCRRVVKGLSAMGILPSRVRAVQPTTPGQRSGGGETGTGRQTGDVPDQFARLQLFARYRRRRFFGLSCAVLGGLALLTALVLGLWVLQFAPADVLPYVLWSGSTVAFLGLTGFFLLRSARKTKDKLTGHVLDEFDRMQLFARYRRRRFFGLFFVVLGGLALLTALVLWLWVLKIEPAGVQTYMLWNGSVDAFLGLTGFFLLRSARKTKRKLTSR